MLHFFLEHIEFFMGTLLAIPSWVVSAYREKRKADKEFDNSIIQFFFSDRINLKTFAEELASSRDTTIIRDSHIKMVETIDYYFSNPGLTLKRKPTMSKFEEIKEAFYRLVEFESENSGNDPQQEISFIGDNKPKDNLELNAKYKKLADNYIIAVTSFIEYSRDRLSLILV